MSATPLFSFIDAALDFAAIEAQAAGLPEVANMLTSIGAAAVG